MKVGPARHVEAAVIGVVPTVLWVEAGSVLALDLVRAVVFRPVLAAIRSLVGGAPFLQLGQLRRLQLK